MFKLSTSQKDHLNRIVKATEHRMRRKYTAGAEEHGGDLWDKDCLKEAFDEVIDLMTYLMTELLKRGKPRRKVIAVDLDGTLCRGVCWTAKDVLRAKPRKNIIAKVNRLHRDNFIVIYTARRDHLIPATMQWLKRNGVSFHAISNLKTAADLYIDDLAVRPEERW